MKIFSVKIVIILLIFASVVAFTISCGNDDEEKKQDLSESSTEDEEYVWEYKGVSYISWSKEDFPWALGWKPQTYFDSQAITAVSLTSDCNIFDKGALRLEVDLDGTHPNKKNGEVYIDIRYHPPLLEQPCCLNAPINFHGIQITAAVYCPTGIAGESSKPNGLQLFVKDENWRSFYGSWYNIKENQINYISMIPSTDAPLDGYMDNGFDPTKVLMLGLKIAVGTGSSAIFSGSICLNSVEWEFDGCTARYDFTDSWTPINAIKNINCNYTALISIWYMDTPSSTIIYPDSEKTVTDEKMISTINAIHNEGMGVMLKPHVDVKDNSWRAEINPSNLTEWFESYKSFILHYASLAQANEIEVFCIGNELISMTDIQFTDYWQNLTTEIRNIYDGKLTYAAHWAEEYKNILFWDSLDIAGINAYFPISDEEDPSVDDLIKGWEEYPWHNWVEEINSWRKANAKSVIFSEIGYCNRDYAAKEPWNCDDGFPNCELQMKCYTAALTIWKNKSWFKGMFWYNWLPFYASGGCCDVSYSPQNKPSEEVLSSYFSD